MNVARRSGAGVVARTATALLLAGVPAAALVPTTAGAAVPGSGRAPAAASAAGSTASPAAAAVPASAAPGTFTGKGFDACTAPSPDLMSAWKTSSPYGAVGIYIGGGNRGCQQPQLTAEWVSQQVAAGWRLLPIYMGPQPECTTSSKRIRFTPAQAAATGRTAGSDAVLQARSLGIPKGSTVFLDVEAYKTGDAPCRRSVLDYQSAWTARLHDLGYASGFYSSLGSGIVDQVSVYTSTSWVRPDYLWFARYDGVAVTTHPSIPSAYWPHRRLKQYQSPAQTGGAESYGARTLQVDRNQIDVRRLPRTPFGDFGGNGWSDLLAKSSATGDVYVYGGNGTRFSGSARLGSVRGLNALTRLGDMDGDGHEDVVAREKATGALWLYRGTGSGFAPRVKIGGSGWNSMRQITAVGDLTGDRRPDLLAVHSSSGCLYVYPGRGTSLAARTNLGCGWNARSELTGVGDLDRDGRVDLLARERNGDLWLYPGTAGGGLGTRTRVGTGWSGMRDLTGVGDLDRDGVPDLVAIKTATGELFRYLGRKGGVQSGQRIGTGWTAWGPLL
jgi:hypothetical protein